MLIRPVFPEGAALAAWEASPESLETLRGSVTVIVNDITRPAVTRALLEPVEAALLGRASVLVATGAHRDVSSTEKDALLGGLFRGAPWTCNSRGGGDRISLGRTSFGTGVLVHPWLLSSDALLVAGSVEPHYFAGFTGGRKAILPGCAAYTSIEDNHFLACAQGSSPAILEGNPVHEDMEEAAAMVEAAVRVVMAGSVVRGREGLYMRVGGLSETFRACVESARRNLCVELEGRAGCLVLKPGSGLETNLYQSMKAVYNFEAAVMDGGTVILSSGCPGGLGADHMEQLMIESMNPSTGPVTRASYRLGMHAAARLSRIRRRAVLALHSGLDPELVRRLGFVPVEDPHEFALRSGGSIIEMDDAGCLTPVICISDPARTEGTGRR